MMQYTRLSFERQNALHRRQFNATDAVDARRLTRSTSTNVDKNTDIVSESTAHISKHKSTVTARLHNS